MTKKKKSAPESPFHFVQQENPFSEMSEKEFNEFVDTLAENSETGFRTALEQLPTILPEIDLLLLLSSFGYYALTSDGLTRESELPFKVVQHHVELLQAFCLMNALPHDDFPPILANSFEQVLELLTTLSLTFGFKRVKALRSEQPQREKTRLFIQEDLRLNTQFVRNWGYPEQVERTVKQLFARFDDRVEVKLGIRIEHLVTASFRLMSLIEGNCSGGIATNGKMG